MTNDFNLADAGLSGLHEAARRMGVSFSQNRVPVKGFVEANGLSLHYLDWGNRNAPTIVLLHGFAQNSHSFDFVSLGLSDRFRVLALDLRGHGESDWSSSQDYERKTMVGDVIEMVERLKLAPTTIVGLSLGGTVGYMMTAAKPKLVRSLVIVDIAPKVEKAGVKRIRGFVEGKDYFSSLDDMLDEVRKFRPERTQGQLRGSVLRNAKQLSDGRWSWKYDPVLRRPEARPKGGEEEERALWKTMESIECPVLIIRGAKSDIISPESVEEMTHRIPNARAATVENAGHLVPGDNPVGFIKAIEPFLCETAIK